MMSVPHAHHSRRSMLRAGLAGAISLTLLPTAATARPLTWASQPRPTGYVVDPNWPKPLPEGWITGEVGGTGVDANDHLITCNRRNLTDQEKAVGQPSAAIIEFDPQGNVVNSWTPDVLPDNLHGVFIDYQSNVWIAGNQDAIVQKYTHDGSALLLQIGTKGMFDTSDGTMQGTPLNSSRTFLNRPADIAVDPVNGDVYIADGYGNFRVVVFDKNGNFLRQWGEPAAAEDAAAGVGGKFRAVVHSVNLASDGNLYVCDRGGDRIQVFTRAGAYLRSIWINKGAGAQPAGTGSAWDLDFSPDATQSLIYNTNGYDELLSTIDRQSGAILASFGRPGHMAGEFTFMQPLLWTPTAICMWVKRSVAAEYRSSYQ